MGNHGWQGDPPPTEQLARDRILSATTRCIDRAGVAKTTLMDIAAEAGITRQTVYRYYQSLGELLRAVAEAGAVDFVERMRTHLAAHQGPLEVVIEAIIFCLEELPREPRIGILLEAEDEDLFGRGITSAAGLGLATQFLGDLPVDWTTNGVQECDLEGLAELMLRLIGSLMQHPPATPRSTESDRAFLRRWLGPALTAPGT